MRNFPVCRHTFYQSQKMDTTLVKLNVVVANQGHPNQRKGGQSERKNLRKTKGHALEDEKLGGKVTQGDEVGPVGNCIDGANVQVVGSVATNDAGNQGPSAEKAASKGSKLVGSLGVVVGGDELLSRVFRLELVGLGREFGVSDESTVVDSAGEVEGRVGLQRVAD
jgi:hypothetical protein